MNGSFTYYATLYVKLRKAYETDQEPLREVYFNSILDLDAPFLLALRLAL